MIAIDRNVFRTTEWEELGRSTCKYACIVCEWKKKTKEQYSERLTGRNSRLRFRNLDWTGSWSSLESRYSWRNYNKAWKVSASQKNTGFPTEGGKMVCFETHWHTKTLDIKGIRCILFHHFIMRASVKIPDIKATGAKILDKRASGCTSQFNWPWVPRLYL